MWDGTSMSMSLRIVGARSRVLMGAASRPGPMARPTNATMPSGWWHPDFAWSKTSTRRL